MFVAKLTIICHQSPLPAHAVSLAIATTVSAMVGQYIEINRFVFVTLEIFKTFENLRHKIF